MSDENDLALQDLDAVTKALDDNMGSGGSSNPGQTKELDAIYDIPVQISAVLGKSSMQVSQLLKLGRGAVVELDRKVGEAIDIYVNNRLVARGEVVVAEENFGIRIKEVLSKPEI